MYDGRTTVMRPNYNLVPSIRKKAEMLTRIDAILRSGFSIENINAVKKIYNGIEPTTCETKVLYNK